jgi:YesN/AraC family two-component response regulator
VRFTGFDSNQNILGGASMIQSNDIQSSRTGYKLLVADDEELVRKRLRELGERAGFQVQEARNGTEAWKIYQEFQPDLSVIDIYMPGMNGLTVLFHIKEKHPESPVILITGFLHYEQIVQVSRIKPDACLIKPLKSDEITALMNRLVAEHRADKLQTTIPSADGDSRAEEHEAYAEDLLV